MARHPFTDIKQDRGPEGDLRAVRAYCQDCEQRRSLDFSEWSGALGLTCSGCGARTTLTPSDPGF